MATCEDILGDKYLSERLLAALHAVSHGVSTGTFSKKYLCSVTVCMCCGTLTKEPDVSLHCCRFTALRPHSFNIVRSFMGLKNVGKKKKSSTLELFSSSSQLSLIYLNDELKVSTDDQCCNMSLSHDSSSSSDTTSALFTPHAQPPLQPR